MTIKITMHRRHLHLAVAASLALGAVAGASAGEAEASAPSFLGGKHVTSSSPTVPANGDMNPYGVANVPVTKGKLVKGSVLVSNFNDAGNAQGTGSTIVELAPGATSPTLFSHVTLTPHQAASCPGGVGLTTALAVFSRGFVVVGSLPTTDGTEATARAGCLIVLDSNGKVVRTIGGRRTNINGPWDLTALDQGTNAVLFVTNVLNGPVLSNPAPPGPGQIVDQGTVVRIRLQLGDMPMVVSDDVIGSGFAERTDPMALIVGPTGLAVGDGGTLYVADTADNRIAAISHAARRTTDAHTGDDLTAGGMLNGPLGLAVAPNGNVISVNALDGNAVETTPTGNQIASLTLDATPVTGFAPGNGSLFGVAITPDRTGFEFVDDIANTLSFVH